MTTSKYADRIRDNNLMRFLVQVRMSERDKEIISKYMSGETSYKEIAAEYGISPTRVVKLQSRGFIGR